MYCEVLVTDAQMESMKGVEGIEGSNHCTVTGTDVGNLYISTTQSGHLFSTVTLSQSMPQRLRSGAVSTRKNSKSVCSIYRQSSNHKRHCWSRASIPRWRPRGRGRRRGRAVSSPCLCAWPHNGKVLSLPTWQSPVLPVSWWCVAPHRLICDTAPMERFRRSFLR